MSTGRSDGISWYVVPRFVSAVLFDLQQISLGSVCGLGVTDVLELLHLSMCSMKAKRLQCCGLICSVGKWNKTY
eukprot:4212057-Amphidinium_carterae.1